MRLANISDRLTLCYQRWDELVEVAATLHGAIGKPLAQVAPEEFDDPDNIDLGCAINGEEVQRGSTADMVFPVSEIISRLSTVTPLLPGDVIFTGTPPGVGVGRVPQRFLAPGDELVTYMRGVGEMRHRMQAQR